ncbi:hypothetical protein [Paenibacillus sp. Soil787]|uniref:hypothetical protein n=1 Tax=Paenibacillus sp. Soil787 TaxID=1736411 RepID=UPI0006F4DD55|nr:hypothetical protein [Paenibacillus sp. Soil787]KRF35862.1 hypothetical protein ASG93_25605 [Paenibacillus sp. Soil787]
MPTVQQILNKADKYRNSYSTDDKVDWMDAGQKVIYQEVPHESVPFSFTTVSGFSAYPLPIKQIRIAISQNMQ